jgi:pyrroloquinoline-quinone synthase
MTTLEQRLLAAVTPHDLLCHPFYQAWSMGTLTRADLAGYAAQYRHQVEALPSLLRAAMEQTAEPALERNLDEEEGRQGPAHAALWARFAAALDARAEEPVAETRASGAALRALCEEGPVQSLAALWAYEMQTVRVSRTKREGLARYGVSEVSFFALHEQLDVHHAADLLAALQRRCGDDPALQQVACDAAARSAQAQWLFLDGAEKRRS